MAKALKKTQPPVARERRTSRQMPWWIALVLGLPLTISQTTMEVLLPRFILLAVFLLAWLWYFYGGRNQRLEWPLATPLIRAIGVLGLSFLVILALASLGATNQTEGLYRSLRYFLFFTTIGFFALTVAREEGKLLGIFQALTLTLAGQAAVGILQYYGLAFTELPPSLTPKPIGLLANRTAFSSGLALLLPFVGYLVYAGNRKWRVIGGVALWLGIYAIIISASRSGWLAVLTCVLASNLLVLARWRCWGAAWLKGWFLGMAGLALGTALAIALVAVLPSPGHDNAGLKNRALSVLQLSERNTSIGSGQWRLLMWRHTAQMLADHPWLGVGPGNYRLLAPRYGFYENNVADAQDMMVPDHAHNVYLEIGAETGVPGLLVYLGLMGLATGLALKVIFQADRNDRRMVGLASLGTLWVYSVDSIFSFPNEFIFHGLLLALGVGMALGIHERMIPAAASRKQWHLPKAGWWLLTGVLLLGIYLGYAKWNFEVHLRRAMGYESQQRYEMILREAAAGLNPLVKLSPRGVSLETYQAIAYAKLGQPERALVAYQQARVLNPLLIPNLNGLGGIYLQLKQAAAARDCFAEILRLAPDFVEANYNLGLADCQLGQWAEAIQYFQTTVRLNPDYVEAYNNLGTALYQQGQMAAAVAAYQAALRVKPGYAEARRNLALAQAKLDSSSSP